MDREILKTGLHRELRTNFTFTANEAEQDKCSIVIREAISKDVYIYLEEAEALKNFDFWPHEPMDIEKPASTAAEYEFIWRVPLGYDQERMKTWVKSFSKDKEGG